MRCDEVREILEESGPEEIAGPVRRHLMTCPACEAYARDWGLVRAGFRALRQEQAPEPTLGFAARLIRRFEEAAATPDVASVFLEQAGRRVVYATLVLALTLIMALVLPPSGPLRGPDAMEVLGAQPEVVMGGNDPVLPYELSDSNALAPINSTNETKRGQK